PGSHRGLVAVNLAELMASLTANKGHGKNRCGQYLAFHGEVVVKVVGDLERGGSSNAEAAVGCEIRAWKRTGSVIVEGAVVHRGLLCQRRIPEGVLLKDAVQRAVIEDAKTTVDGGYSTTVGGVGEPDARSEV